jgi:hypothetical protein
MIDSIISTILKALPKGQFKLMWIPADLEGPGELIWRLCPPDTNLILESKGFLKGWKRVGEFDDDEDLVFLRESEYDRLFPVFQAAFKEIGREDVKIIKRDITLAAQEFYARCGYSPFE